MPVQANLFSGMKSSTRQEKHMHKRIALLFSLSILVLNLTGCRTLHPPSNEENPQPWAQPEDWQRTQGIPGFSRNQNPDY